MDNILAYYVKAGPVSAAIGLLAVLMWALIFRRWRALRGLGGDAESMLGALSRGIPLRGGNPLERFANETAACAARGGVGLLEAARECGRGVPQKLQAGMPLIAACCSAAPLIGLFGTVEGMMTTFSALGDPAGEGSHRMAEGVSRALLTTEIGLVVAIPGVLVLGALRRRAERAQLQIERLVCLLALRQDQPS